MFPVRKRSANVAAAKFYMCESATTATTKRPVGTEINPSYGDQQIIKAHFSNSLIGKMSFIFYSTN
ncbi:hypothetical protein [Lysinibacillus sphaericus]|uniref:hypothetical protein n=1 Tax=Lysinibacillus sphaericus TaxID=1421 RepID=UPI001CC0966E|nr:hypothetical protein [Lysinibacillus sphaericus]